MQTNCRSIRAQDSRPLQIAPMLVASCLLAATILATPQAAESSTIVQRPAARDTAFRDADRQAQASKASRDDFVCRPPALEREPLRDLLDKCAPSAIEWSLLLHIADRSSRPTT